ncbi:phosphoribosylaminoimidazole carboxylase [Phakopsora pachyrhizi]|uniref:Phosphoribosylaminoimidazole carboxylase n=1 Tax=Phakopsora pachyrhizi TaxID=170000 RepID=A0AAV0BFE8_PHAPC|nr:phosphoribosylaminoimidazole carboxylase [Phakopsora pachyrhizi]
MDKQVIGVLGGGQLGRMMVQAASRLSIPLITLDAQGSPASQVSNPEVTYPEDLGLRHHVGSFNDAESILQFSSSVDILTVEIEHVNVKVLKQLEADPSAGRLKTGLKIYPSPAVIELIQDKFLQKQFLRSRGVAVVDFEEVSQKASLDELKVEVRRVGERLGFPLMLKSRLLAYDGRGNYLIKDPVDIEKAILSLSSISSNQDFSKLKLYAERFVTFSCEIAVMVVRGKNSRVEPGTSRVPECELRTYQPVETVHRNSICHTVYSPLRRGGPKASDSALKLAEDAISALGNGAVGVFGVEMFLLPDGNVLLNEIAPRPHNSYHHTISSTPVSQFTAHLLAISSQTLPPQDSFKLAVPSAAMVNILGYENGKPGEDQIKLCVELASQLKGTSIEMYGKRGCKRGRKMGHINVVGESDSEVRQIVSKIERLLPSDQQISSLESLIDDHSYGLKPIGFSDPNPLVSIIMGSDSDLPTMIEASRILSKPQFRVPHELTIVSAHRTPDRMTEFAKSAASRGIKVIIAGAGGAAHLPGMVSALTPLPVIGVPVIGKVLDGIDSLHSIVQMPRGIPVATVAIGNSTNAALLAIRIISVSIPRLIESMTVYMSQMENEVMNKVSKLEEVGWENY